jgi:hypothetical protein
MVYAHPTLAAHLIAHAPKAPEVSCRPSIKCIAVFGIRSSRIDRTAQIHPTRWTGPLFYPDPVHASRQTIGLPAQKQRRLKIAAHLQGPHWRRGVDVDTCARRMPAPRSVQPAQFTVRPSTPSSRGVSAGQQHRPRTEQHAPAGAGNAGGQLPEPGELRAQRQKRQATDQALEQHTRAHRIDDRWGFVHTDCVSDARSGAPLRRA